MHKVVTINLNGHAYQLEEAGYNRLRAYLEEVEKSLCENPDKQEITSDFEQAIADKSAQYLSGHKNVLADAEIKTIIEEMGPVAGEEKQEQASDSKTPEDSKEPRRLYQIREGAMLSGLCAGIGAYFNIDPTWVRFGTIIMTLATSGAWIAVHVLLMIVVPVARTPEEKAAAFGERFSANEFLERARTKYADLGDKKRWQNFSERFPERRDLVDNWKVFTKISAGILSFMLSLVIGVLAIIWVMSLVSILATGTIWGDLVMTGPSILAHILFATCIFLIVLLPLRGTGAAMNSYANSQPDTRSGLWQTGSFLLWLVAIVFACVLAYSGVPEVNDGVNGLFLEITDAYACRGLGEGCAQ
jgi:phage shock protein PspC (stress-responsive transcriptional regulator)